MPTHDHPTQRDDVSGARSRGRPGVRRTLGRGVLAAAFVLIAAAGVLSWQGLAQRLEPADAAVVPGNTVHPDGRPSARLRGRLDAALAIYRAGLCKVVVVSGAVGAEGVDEAVAMKRYLVQQGVPPDHVIQDSHGYNTAATARNTAQALRQRGYRSVIAVSQFFHVPRLRWLLANEGLVVAGQAHAQYFELRDGYALLRELAALAELAATGG